MPGPEAGFSSVLLFGQREVLAEVLVTDQKNDGPNDRDHTNAVIESRRHWLGLPLAPRVHGTLTDLRAGLPHFGRQPFAMASLNGDDMGVNHYLDMIYRMGTRQGERSLPIGVVSKNYRLVDHHQVLQTVEQALLANRIDTTMLQVTGQWTVHGERAHFSIVFPHEDRFTYKDDQEDGMRFRLEIFNSVEGSWRLIAIAGWLRFVCSNGLIVGSALMHLRQQHRKQLEIEELGRLLREAIQNTSADKDTFRYWSSQAVDPDALASWVDEDICKKWGPKAAVRVFGIVRYGIDVTPVGSMKDRYPSEVEVKELDPVPGINGSVKTIFGVGQVLTWLAGQRSELAEDLDWRGQVPDLIEKLLARTRP